MEHCKTNQKQAGGNSLVVTILVLGACLTNTRGPRFESWLAPIFFQSRMSFGIFLTRLIARRLTELISSAFEASLFGHLTTAPQPESQPHAK